MLKKYFYSNFGRFKHFEIFCPPWPFWKIYFLANFFEVYSDGLDEYFWCYKVRRMLKNTSM